MRGGEEGGIAATREGRRWGRGRYQCPGFVGGRGHFGVGGEGQRWSLGCYLVVKICVARWEETPLGSSHWLGGDHSDGTAGFCEIYWYASVPRGIRIKSETDIPGLRNSEQMLVVLPAASYSMEPFEGCHREVVISKCEMLI